MGVFDGFVEPPETKVLTSRPVLEVIYFGGGGFQLVLEILDSESILVNSQDSLIRFLLDHFNSGTNLLQIRVYGSSDLCSCVG